MRVSKEKQSDVRRSLVYAAVELFTEQGFSNATMRDISNRAGLSAGTIYNYFPTKEKIFYAYFDLKQDELKETISGINAFSEFTLKEKLQTLLESLLESYKKEREFVAQSYKMLLDSPMRSYTELIPVKEKFGGMVRECFDAAVQTTAIPPQPFESFLIDLFWDYTNLVVLYWLRDDTDAFANTSRLIDLSLDIYVDLVASNMVTKTADVLAFLFKSHIYGNINKLYQVFSVLTNAPEALRGASIKPAAKSSDGSYMKSTKSSSPHKVSKKRTRSHV